jgi:hypothetical protein
MWETENFFKIRLSTLAMAREIKIIRRIEFIIAVPALP